MPQMTKHIWLADGPECEDCNKVALFLELVTDSIHEGYRITCGEHRTLDDTLIAVWEIGRKVDYK